MRADIISIRVLTEQKEMARVQHLDKHLVCISTPEKLTILICITEGWASSGDSGWSSWFQILPGRRETADIPSGESKASKVWTAVWGWSWSEATLRLWFLARDGFIHKVLGTQMLQLSTHIITSSKIIDQCAILLLWEKTNTNRGPKIPKLYTVGHVEILQSKLSGREFWLCGSLKEKRQAY